VPHFRGQARSHRVEPFAVMLLSECSMRRSVPIAVAGVLALGSLALGVPDYGYQWATIGDPGNRATLPEEVPDRPELQIGSVGYEYRMAITEVTVGQWLEFVRAYQPHYTGSANAPAFTGFGIINLGGQYIAIDDERAPTTMSWEFAARYCNWLHNGKALTQDAFENGAYDSSTFTFNEDNTANHQLSHNPSALFWIPTLDEWTKAAHWDQEKNNGEGGYWRYPGASDTPLIPGPPEHGGQTNAGRTESGEIGPLGVGWYPEVNGPWGLLDTSGGVREWLSSTLEVTALPAVRGSSRGSVTYAFADQVESILAGGITNPSSGLRLASIVPAPHSAVVFGMASLGLCVRRRRS